MALRNKNKYPRAGDLDTQVEIKTPNYVSDGQGGRILNTSTPYTVADTVWAQVLPVRGSRLSEYGLTVNDKPREVKMRKPLWSGAASYTVDEEVLLNLKEESIELHIQDVLDIDNMGEWLMIIAVERK